MLHFQQTINSYIVQTFIKDASMQAQGNCLATPEKIFRSDFTTYSYESFIPIRSPILKPGITIYIYTNLNLHLVT